MFQCISKNVDHYLAKLIIKEYLDDETQEEEESSISVW